jgi:hypothetical protein
MMLSIRWVVGVARKRCPPGLLEFGTADVSQLRLVYLVHNRVPTVCQPIACVAHRAAKFYLGDRARSRCPGAI